METILVVDDDKVFRELLTTVLTMEGYRAVVESSPEDVIPAVREEKPALILMDVHIRNHDTLGVLRTLKGDEDLNDVPVVMTSGMNRSDECISGGADAFVMKPFRPSEMLDRISELLRSREQCA